MRSSGTASRGDEMETASGGGPNSSALGAQSRTTLTVVADRAGRTAEKAPPARRASVKKASGSSDRKNPTHGPKDEAAPDQAKVDPVTNAVVLINQKISPDAPVSTHGNALTQVELKHSKETSGMLAKACTKHPRGQAGVAKALDIKPQMMSHYCNATDVRSLPIRAIPLLPPKVRTCLVTLLEEAYSEKDEDTLPVVTISPEIAAGDVVGKASDVLRGVLKRLEDGVVKEDELAASEKDLDEMEQVVSRLRHAMRHKANGRPS